MILRSDDTQFSNYYNTKKAGSTGLFGVYKYSYSYFKCFLKSIIPLN
jgi:hypothetical protein